MSNWNSSAELHGVSIVTSIIQITKNSEKTKTEVIIEINKYNKQELESQLKLW